MKWARACGFGHSSFLMISKLWLSWVNTSTTEQEKRACSEVCWNCCREKRKRKERWNRGNRMTKTLSPQTNHRVPTSIKTPSLKLWGPVSCRQLYLHIDVNTEAKKQTWTCSKLLKYFWKALATPLLLALCQFYSSECRQRPLICLPHTHRQPLLTVCVNNKAVIKATFDWKDTAIIKCSGGMHSLHPSCPFPALHWGNPWQHLHSHPATEWQMARTIWKWGKHLKGQTFGCTVQHEGL